MFSSQNHNPNSHPFVFLVLLVLLIFPISSKSHDSPKVLTNHCAFANGNRYYDYVYTGNNSIRYVETPFDGGKPSWKNITITSAITWPNFTRPACSVTSDNILYVTGKPDIIKTFDLNNNTADWQIPRTNGVLNANISTKLSHLEGHRSIVVKTLKGEEVLFIYGGCEQSRDTFILNVKNLTWETVLIGPDTPPPISQFGIISFKDNIYIIGGSIINDTHTYSNEKVWAFHVPTRKWFNPDMTLNTVYDGYAGKLNNTVYIIDSGNPSKMWAWNLVDSSKKPLKVAGPPTPSVHDYYAFAQLPDSDVIISWNETYLTAFNMTQQNWTEQVNVTKVPVDQFSGGPLAPGQEDPFPPQKINSDNSDNKRLSTDAPVPVVVVAAAIGVAAGLLRPSSQIYRPPRFEASGFQSERYSVASETIPVSDFQTFRTLPRTIKVNSTASLQSKLINDLYARYKVTTITSESPFITSVSPSTPAGTVIFDRYRLNGAPAYCGNNSVRHAEDETVSEEVTIKFFSNYDSFEREVVMLKYLRSQFVGEFRDLFDIPNATNWKYAMIMDQYSMSLDNFIVSRSDIMDELYIKMVVRSLAQAIQHVHNHGIVHLDIKPGNFVHEVGNMNKWRLIDFEAARVDGEEYVDSSTLRYSSPEIINAAALRTSIKADISMDMWSLGCIIYELYTRSPLFSCEQDAKAKLLEAYFTEDFIFPAYRVADTQARHVLQKLLISNPKKRASIEDILRGAYLTGGADTTQIYNMQSESTEKLSAQLCNIQSKATERIISAINQAANVILSQFDVIVNSISDTRDATVPRLFMLFPGKEPHTMFKPHAWGKNTFILHILCEGLISDNSEAHFTIHHGYKIFDPKPFLAKTGPYLSILATLVGSAVGFFTRLQFPEKIADAIDSIATNQMDYFKKISEVINQAETDGFIAKDLAAVPNDPLNRMKCAQGPAMRELEAFLAANDPSHEFGGLYRITMNDGRWRWVCNGCRERAYENHQD
ncbi:1088_t:CDS:2 [Paraglomus brasilianum]|uniref:1088_t:CDS:1 n=1 Tax=Paraglomus brasilianum TaxID=144538 RepID=A0A9N9CVY9_9GLOM|nr:1088_t:CDS:2 [Paraglomus brasilianum]